MRVLTAMSGGVDSSVAAALMKEQGHDVVGVTLKLWSGPNGEAPTAGCCTLSDAEDARRVAATLDIPYYVLDYTEEFTNGVVDKFVGEYATGRTPNPCIECNRTVKFDRLLNSLDGFDAEALVTGHHARTRLAGGQWQLLRGSDRAKDQSYVLSMLTQAELSRTRFPVGEMTKDQVRAIARSLDLRTANKPESMDICFVGQRDYRSFLRGHAPEAFIPGPVVDTAGVEVGAHDGIVGFTVGQRRGLGVAVGEARYVVDIQPSTSTVVIGRRRQLAVESVELSGLTSVNGEPIYGPVTAQYRAHGDQVAATIEAGGLVFDVPQEGVAPGQTLALYDADVVLGGGIIATAKRVAA